jgi:RNA polymerase sigma-70 factor, ECF subfamily
MAMIGVQTRSTNNSEPAKAVWPQAVALPSAEAQQELASIEAVKAGNPNAFQYLVETYQSRVYNLALRMLANEQEAQDAAQDAFVQAYTRLASYRSEWRFKTWMMAITSNLCVDRLRRRRIEPTTFSDHTEDPDAEFVSHEPLPEVAAARHEQQATIRAMLNLLAPEDRGMVVMFYWGDMSYEEIARMTGSTVNAVKSRLFRARRALAQSTYAVNLRGTGEA